MKLKPSLIAAGLVATMAIALPTAASAAPGDLDPSWDGDGILEQPGSANDVLVQPDGKVLAGSNAGFGDVLLRFNADGTPDTSFDGDGSINVGDLDAIALQSDGKIVIAANSFTGNVSVARYNADGSEDTSFDGDGAVETDLGGNEYGIGLTIDSSGRIVVVGKKDSDWLVLRYLTGGGLDTSFDGDGWQTVVFGSAFDEARDVEVQSSGRIVVGGLSGGDFALAGLTNAGALDGTFGAGGQRTTDMGGNDQAFSIARLSDNRIVAVGHRDNDVFAVAMYDANGTLDASCDNDGKLEIAFAAGFEEARDVAVQFNDRVVIAGVDGNSFALARLEPADCSLDTTFGGGDGKVVTPIPGFGNGAYAVAIHGSTGKISVAGESSGEPGDLIIARYEGDEPPPPQQPPPQQPPPEEPPPGNPCANDTTGPALSIRSLQDKALYRQSQSPASVRIEASDPSGLVSDPSDPSRSISTSERGKFTVTVTARDNCNNVSTAEFVYRVAGDPAIGLAGVQASCTSSNFIATIRITTDVSLRTVTARLNGRLLAKGTKSRLSFKVPAKRLRAGRHRLAIATVDRAGNRSTRTVSFARCVVVEPSFTG